MLLKQLRDELEIMGNKSKRQIWQIKNMVIQFRKTRSTQKSMFCYEDVKIYTALPNEIKSNMKDLNRLSKLKNYNTIIKRACLWNQ